MINNLLAFFNNFTVDTLLGIISCILGVVALFIGGTAYKKCKINNTIENNKTVNKKKLTKSADDHSNNASGDMLVVHGDYYGSNDNSLAELNKENFSVALNKAYEMFSAKCDDNLKQITQEAKRIIDEKKITLGSYTKLDWINIYFESAKNTSDTYMQNVWAKVLVQELSKPDSFSYKTLDILKNMSAKDFHLFDYVSKYIVSKSFVPNNTELNQKYGLQYINIIKLNEYGLINSSGMVTQTFTIDSEKFFLLKNGSYVLLGDGVNSKVEMKEFVLSNSGKELLTILGDDINGAYFIDFAKGLKQKNTTAKLSLHKILNEDPNGRISFDLEDLI